FMTLLGTFSALLARYSAQEDIVIGSPIAGRNRVEFENVIGLFVNTLALRTNLSGNPSFRELLTRVREATLGAYAHQDLPFEKIVEELRPERDLSRNPIFQVMFAMQNVPGERENVPGLSITRFAAADKATAKFDLLATATERSDGLRMTFEYSTDLFAATTIQRMQQHYLNLLQAVVVDPNCSVGELPLLGPDERQQQITVWNQTSAAIPAICIHEAFEAQAHRRPSAIAVTFDGKNLTYSELNRRADCLANYLCGLGVRPETLVGIYLDRSLEMVIALLAVLKAGGAYVPLDPSFPAERIGFILADAEVSVLLTSEALRGNVPSHGAQVICIDRHWSSISEAPAASTRGTVTPANLAYVLYTSGSTGKPKGVAVEHSAVVNFLESMRREPGLSSEDVLLAVTTLSFDIAGLELYLPLTSGAQVVIAGSHDVVNAKKLISLLEHSKTTVMQATPATWRMLLDSGWKGSSKLKALCGGEALPGQLAQQLQQCCRELWNLYGPTETTIWSSLYRVEEPNEATVSIGKPIANTQMYVLDRQRNLLPVGAVGELYIGGAGLARGYWQRPELTAEKFVVNPFGFSTPTRLYRTGDLVRYLPDGNLQYVARLDNQVKVRGHRIELEEIEFSLSAHPLVQEVVVIVREDTPGNQRLVAYVVSRNGAPLSVVDLRVHLKETLPDYMIPSAFVQMDQLPLTPNRKIDRRSLPPPQNFGTGRAESPGARDDLEQTLVSIWETVLGIQGIGIRDNFFELGGHSLLAVRLVAEILAATGKDVPLAALFQGATVEYLASLLRDEGQPAHQMVIEIQRGSSEQKFFAIVTPGINALGYRTLAHYLGPEQSFYRIQGPGPRVTERPYSASEFEKMAREYIRAMKAVQPKGPYYLGGMCEGARIAFDMARALEADGEQVGLLAIFDTWVLENSQNRLLWKINYFSGRIKRFQRLPITQKRALMKKWASNLLYPEARARSTWPQAYWPGNHFVPAKYRGKITVFKFRNQPYYYVNDPLMGWGSRTTGKVELQVMNLKIRKHMLLFREPYVNELAKKLAECLARAVPNNVNQRHAERADSPLILPGPQLTSVEP
ncbi:MAG TPA: amino acid adenylation domain-containing protein, partial [Terriglobales bacterium]|nr:amino acid adenylation domain-containing protein [Terriglobales bacterium]